MWREDRVGEVFKNGRIQKNTMMINNKIKKIRIKVYSWINDQFKIVLKASGILGSAMQPWYLGQ